MNTNHQKLYEAINNARNNILKARSEADTVELLPDELCNGLNQLQLFIDFALVKIIEGNTPPSDEDAPLKKNTQRQ